MKPFAKTLCLSLLLELGAACAPAADVASVAVGPFPRIYVSPSDRQAIVDKIRTEPWADAAFKNLLSSIDPIVDRTQKDREWALSRMAMYWKDGQRYTQCYLKKQNWDRGEGNAPVPTVRLPGMRVWNDYVNVPLEDRTPFNETGDMLARSRRNPQDPPVVVSYKQSGHLIRSNNAEILTLAENAAFAHWVTGDEKYARFAADIYWAWLLGTYYMNPPLDPDKSSGGPGGFEPGGILGYYDYEQIHDDLMMHAAPIYDFIFDYLKAHPHPHLDVLKKDLPTLSGIVFKRFIDIGFVRGGKSGNWNVNGWAIMMRGILALEPDSFYPDGHGREYYLKHYTTITTQYHDALPDILKQYSPVTGLWPESPGYALGTINSLLDFALPVRRAGVDTISGNPILQKAAFAVFPWMDARGNIVVFGDSRGGPANFSVFERLLTYYRSTGDTANAAIAATAIQKGLDANQYDRGNTSWEGICLNQPLDKTQSSLPAPAAAYSEIHRHIIMRNLNDTENGLMFTLYGGTNGKHLSPNGLAAQFYGKGWALAPDASAYESYWSADKGYHQSATGSNTILPGYAEGPITINAMDPQPAPDAFTADEPISPSISFVDVSAGEKRRIISIVRTSPTTGYYVDIFRSRQQTNDYLYHNLGTSLSLTDAAGQPLKLEPATLDPAPSRSYSFFNNVQRAAIDGPLQATWTIDTVTPHLFMSMWMNGGPSRQAFQMDAPPTTLVPFVTPGGACLAPKPTPTLIVRQTNRDGWDSPFLAVLEPYAQGARSITKITELSADPTFAGATVESKLTDASTRRDTILTSTDPARKQTLPGLSFQGDFAAITSTDSTPTDYYLGTGHLLADANVTIQSADTHPIKARLYRTGATWHYSSDRDVIITLPNKTAQHLAANKDAPIP